MKKWLNFGEFVIGVGNVLAWMGLRWCVQWVVDPTIIDPPMSFLVSLKKRFKSQNTKRVFFLVCFFHYFFDFYNFLSFMKRKPLFFKNQKYLFK